MPDDLAESLIHPRLPKQGNAKQSPQGPGWELFLIVALASLFVVLGAPVGYVFALAGIVAVLCAWRFPYAGFYIFLALALLTNWIVSIWTGRLEFSDRVFGGTIDIGVGELAAMAVFAAWTIRLFIAAIKDKEKIRLWRPWLPFVFAFVFLVVAQILSLFSIAQPDPLLVVKYALRPVFLVYLTCILLPVNFIQTKKRLLSSLLVLVAIGIFFALDGFRSLAVPINGSYLHFAVPMPILGRYPIGDNHNALAEILVFLAPASMALAALVRSRRAKRLAGYAAVFMAGIALLTFARSAWLAIGIEAVFLFATLWRPWLKKHIRTFLLLCIACVPLLGAMAVYSAQSEVKGSNESRALLASIAWDLFKSSPWIGVGAGAFVDRVAHVYAFTIEFGSPLDAHGMLQKVGAETGLIGLFALACVFWLIVSYGREAWTFVRKESRDERAVFYFLASGAIGAFVYQLFSTTSWTSHLWLPIGMFLAAARVLPSRHTEDPEYLNSHG